MSLSVRVFLSHSALDLLFKHQSFCLLFCLFTQNNALDLCIATLIWLIENVPVCCRVMFYRTGVALPYKSNFYLCTEIHYCRRSIWDFTLVSMFAFSEIRSNIKCSKYTKIVDCKISRWNSLLHKHIIFTLWLTKVSLQSQFNYSFVILAL